MLHWFLYVALLVLNFISDKIVFILANIEDNTVIPLYDIFYCNVSDNFLMFDKFYMPDMFVIISLFLAYPYSLSYAFIKLHMILLLVRFLCVISTSGYSSIRYAYRGDTRGMFNRAHNDLVISGHTMYKTLCLLFILSNSGILYGLFCCIIIVAGILSNLLVGDHYTSDIILGVTLSILIYY